MACCGGRNVAGGRLTSGGMACGECQDTYGPVADAFVLVPDNFNSVTNFVPKLPVYRSLAVQDKAVEFTGASTKCCDTGRGADCYSKGCDTESMGFLMYPQRIRPQAVTVCNKVGCNCGKGSNRLGNDTFTGTSCGRANCTELENHGFVAWPPIGYVKDVKACGPINTEVCCKKHKRRGCRKCKVLVNCKKGGCCPQTNNAGAAAPTGRLGCGCR